MEIFSEAVLSLWDKCELRMLVLLSLLWQVILIILGPMRKHKIVGIKSLILHSVVWVTYLSADWLATVALGNLATNQIAAEKSNSKAESKEQVLQALWAPFLLLHLGGPDTITAYSLEDNTLWKRHLLGLIVQVSVAFYIFLRSWSSNNALTFVAIPVFVSGIIKYSERTWVLRSGTRDQFEESLRTSFLRLEAPNPDQIWNYNLELDCLHTGYSLFPLLKRLYANVALTYQDGEASYSMVRKPLPEGVNPAVYAFKVVQVQLGFLFDVLYTKASIIYTKTGILSRLISAISITSASAAFTVIVNVIDDTYYSRSRVEVVITYILFVGAAFLELYAFVAITLSDWTWHWLTQRQRRSCLMRLLYSSISRVRSILGNSDESSKIYMGQLSLLDLCLKERAKSRFIGNGLFCKIYFEYNMFRSERFQEVDSDLKEIIYQQLGVGHNKRLQDLVGDYRSIIWKHDERLRKLVPPMEIGHQMLVLHAITDVHYHLHYLGGNKAAVNRELEASKKISDYVLYLLLRHPSMLPPWIDRIAYIQDTFHHALQLLSNVTVRDSAHAAKMLIKHLKNYQGSENPRSAFNIFGTGDNDIFNLLGLTELKLNEIWIQLLIYAASHCEWGGSHAQQLTRGGEFLTHLALYMADLGISDNITGILELRS